MHEPKTKTLTDLFLFMSSAVAATASCCESGPRPLMLLELCQRYLGFPSIATAYEYGEDRDWATRGARVC